MISGSKNLTQLLKEHYGAKQVKETFPDVLFDAVFYSKNYVYRNIRDHALERGYHFSPSAKADYLSFQLIYLHEMLNTKVIPVVDNVSSLKKLEKMAPKKFRISEFRMIRPIGSYLLHETAHCLADSEIDIDSIKKTAKTKDKLKLMKIMVGEAYANTADLLASQLTDGGWVAQQNLFIITPLKGLKNLSRIIDHGSVVKITIGLFLYSNFLFSKISDRERSRVMDFAHIPMELRKNRLFLKVFKQIEEVALGLNPTFRLETSQIYLKAMGYHKPLAQLFSFDPVLWLNRNPEFSAQVHALCVLMISNTKKIKLMKMGYY